MKVGAEYINSGEKRAFDLMVSTSLSPFLYIGRSVVRRNLERSTGKKQDPLFLQKRIGRKHEPYVVQKLLTLDPETNQPFDRWAEIVRALSVDELAQIANVRANEMSCTGHRPLVRGLYEETMDSLPPKLAKRWQEIILRDKPGIWSSYALYDKFLQPGQPNGPAIRAEMDIEDHESASFGRDLSLTTQLICLTARRCSEYAVAAAAGQPEQLSLH